jgi:uncharacterized protein (TIRG00374 family)
VKASASMPTSSAPGKRIAKSATRLLVIIALAATLLVPALLGGLHVLVAAAELSLASWGSLCLLSLLASLTRALKIHLLARQLGLRLGAMNTLPISLASEFGFLASPGGVGGYVASIYYLRRAGASVSTASAITAGDQVFDFLFFALLLPIAAIVYLPQAPLRDTAPWLLGALVLIAIASWMLHVCWRRIAAWSRRHRLRWPRLRLLRRKWHRFRHELRSEIEQLRSGGFVFVLVCLACTLLQWFARYGTLWLALRLFGTRIAFMKVLLVQALVLHLAQYTGIPSGGGGAEIGLTAAFGSSGEPAALAAALVVWRVVTLYLPLGAGALAMLALANIPARPLAREAA